MQKYISLEKANMKIEAMAEETEEEDYSIVDAVIASLNLTENMNLALDYRMSGMSYPDIAKCCRGRRVPYMSISSKCGKDIPLFTADKNIRYTDYRLTSYSIKGTQKNLSRIFGLGSFFMYK